MRTQNAVPIAAARPTTVRSVTAGAILSEQPLPAWLQPSVRAGAVAGAVLGTSMGLSLALTTIGWAALILGPLWGLAGALVGAVVGVLELKIAGYE